MVGLFIDFFLNVNVFLAYLDSVFFPSYSLQFQVACMYM